MNPTPPPKKVSQVMIKEDVMNTVCTPLNNCHVLLVEDNLQLVALIKENIEDLHEIGLKLAVAGSLKEARETFLRLHIDAVILDLNLPDSSGISTLREMVRITDGKVAIVVYSGTISPERRSEVVATGAISLLLKSKIEVYGLVEVIKQAILLQRYRNRILEENILLKEHCNHLQMEIERIKILESSNSMPTEGIRELRAVRERLANDVRTLAKSAGIESR